jgi:eukaryotic-like serine/threonine-protein kinase
MKPEHPREEALLQTATQLTGAELTAFLNGACCGDVALRQRLEAMLTAQGQTGFLSGTAAEGVHLREKPSAPQAQSTVKLEFANAGLDEAVGQTIGRYKLLEKVGEGGCGVVYVAEQTEPVRRRVALKVIKLGMDTKQVVARFEAERQALAMMDHPNIAKVLDAGATEAGRPYFVMELVRGIKITDYCDRNNLTTKARLDLFTKVCQAIQHAHQKGIIHRDIKPSNILVTLHDGVPVPKVIDFGIAKATDGRLTDATVYTQLHQFIGTPAYMSPEQAEMSGLDVDTRSDIYSLGVLLYELLTGKTPFDPAELMSQGVDAIRKTICEQEPVRPSTRLATLLVEELTTTAKRRSVDSSKLMRQLKGDLDWIVMKCLEKDRTRRYESASGLAADLLRHLNNQPVVARPPSTAYRLQKAWRRNKLVYGSVAAITAALLLASIISGASYVRERTARVNEQAQRLEAEQQRLAAEASAAGERQQRSRVEALAYATDMNLILQALELNNLGRGQELLNRNRPSAGQPDRRGWEWRYLWKRSRSDELAILGSHDHAISGLMFSPKGDLLASGGFDGKVKLWNWKDQRSAGELEIGDQVQAVAFSPDGRRLAVRSNSHGCQVWDVATRLLIAELNVPATSYSGAVAFSPQGDLLAMNAPGSTIQIWNLSTRSPVATLVGHDHEALIRWLIFSRDAKTLYSTAEDLTVRIWDLTTQRQLAALRGHNRWITSLALMPDESLLASSGSDGTVRIWDLKLRSEKLRLTTHAPMVWDVKFAPDGKVMATCGADQRIRLWDTSTWRETQMLQGHLNEVWRVAFSHDGKYLASGGKDETVKLWSAEPKAAPPRERSFAFGSDREGGTLSSDGRWFWTIAVGRLMVGETRSLRDVRDFIPNGQEDANATAVLLDASGSRLYVGYANGRFGSLDINTGQRTKSPSGLEGAVTVLALSADGRQLASASRSGAVRVQDADSFATTIALTNAGTELNCLCFSRDGRLLAGAAQRDDILLWDLQTGAQCSRMTGHKGRILSLDFSPDGRRLASASWDATAGLWDVATGKRQAVLRAHLLGVNTVAFSPDGQRLAGGTGDGLIKLWNVADGQEVLTLTSHRDINRVVFLPDETLVSVSPNLIQLWPAPSLKEIAEQERRPQRTP